MSKLDALEDPDACCGPGYQCEPYPSVIMREVIACKEQPVNYYWVRADDGAQRWNDCYRPTVAHDIGEDWDGWFLFSHPDDESPEAFDTEEEALQALWEQGPPLHWSWKP